MDIENLIPLKDYAEKIGKSSVSVLRKIQRGTLPGAVKVGRDWMIPKDAKYEDFRVNKGDYKNWRKNTMIVRMSYEEVDEFEYENGKIAIGNIYTVVEKTNVNTGKTWRELIPGDHPVGGNMDQTITRYHGWRGTTNNISVYAEGVRKITDITTYTNGNLKIVLGKDLKADEE